MKGLGLRPEVSGIRGPDLGFGVWGLGSRALGFGFRVKGVGCSGFKINLPSRVAGFGFRVRSSGFRDRK